MVAGERKIVVEHRKELSYLLCQAAEIEHMAMCQYLYAAFSLRTEPGPGLTRAQLDAVERWRTVINEIAVEEMLHWTLVNNLLTAIGSAPFVSRPNLPHRAKGYPPSVQFALLPFGEVALRHFVYFERPQDVDVAEVDEFAPIGDLPAPMRADEIQPRSQDYVSQGELYRALDEGLEHLTESLGEDGLFIGPTSAQAQAPSFGWPSLVAVTDLESARTALVRIIEQGEGGTGQDVAAAHYGRFLTILDEYLELREADPTFEPAHPVTAAIVRTVEDDQPSGPIITDPATAAVSDLFNAANDLALQLLARFFAAAHETPEQLTLLSEVSMSLMSGVIRPLGLLLATLPVGEELPGATAGASFQLAYRSNFLLPHRSVAWIRFVERLDQAATFAEAIDSDPATRAVLAPIVVALRKSALRLATEIEPADADLARAVAATSSTAARIDVVPDGPYRVSGGVAIKRMRDVRSDAGEPLTWEVTERMETEGPVLLCRCGASSTKPFCDSSHRVHPWDPTEAPPPETFVERATVIEGSGLVLRDDRVTCSHAGFCKTRATNIWQMVRELGAADTVARAYVMAMVDQCPSGTLAYRVEPDAEDLERDLPLAVSVIDDGPLFVGGGIPVVCGDGTPLERRNRVTLCRCGASSIKPLCDGSHKAAGFTDAATS